ncbi:S8 family serine peptidase [Streptomyces sp. INA 01156]
MWKDANGADPRPDLAPDIVNNSWGSSVQDPWYQEVVTSWRTAGIFPAFSNGNSGPGCNTTGSPGSYTGSYASGAFDSGNARIDLPFPVPFYGKTYRSA